MRANENDVKTRPVGEGAELPLIVTVLVNWKGADDTLECLESLRLSDYPNQRVVVVDNGSGDGSLEKFKAWAAGDYRVAPEGPVGKDLVSPASQKPVRLMQCSLDESTTQDAWLAGAEIIIVDAGRNFGFAGGVNIGIRCALSEPDTKYVWVLNNDTVVARDCLALMQQRMRDDESIGMCGCRILFYSKPTLAQVIVGARFSPFLGRSRLLGAGVPANASVVSKDIESRMDHLSGASMLVSRSFIETVGLMEESYFLYFEEVDWAARNRDRFSLACVVSAVVYHKEGASIGSSRVHSERSPLSAYYLAHSRLRFTRKFHAWALPGVLAYSLVQTARMFVAGHAAQARAMLGAVRGIGADRALGSVRD